MIRSTHDMVIERGNDWSQAGVSFYEMYYGIGKYAAEYDVFKSPCIIAPEKLTEVLKEASADAAYYGLGITFISYDDEDEGNLGTPPNLVSEDNLHYSDLDDAWLIKSQQSDQDGSEHKAPEAYDNQEPVFKPFWKK